MEVNNGRVEFTEEETKEIHGIVEGMFINPPEGWEDYKGLNYETLEKRLSRSSIHEWSSIYCSAAETFYKRNGL